MSDRDLTGFEVSNPEIEMIWGRAGKTNKGELLHTGRSCQLRRWVSMT